MPAVAGVRGTGDWAVDERPKSFREMILWRNPNGTTPITGLMSKVGKEVVHDPEFSWWDEPNDIVRLTVSGAHTATATTITVTGLDPDATAPDRVWGQATHLVPGDLLLVEKQEIATFDNELLEVTGVISPTQFTVKRGAAGSTAAAIPDAAALLKIGSVYAEGSQSPRAVSRQPIKYFNLCQIFKTTYELTNTAAVTKTRTGDPLMNDKKRRAFDHARDLELSIMFGRRSETTGPNGKPLRTMAGLRAQIPPATTTIFTSATTVRNFLDAVSPVFNFDTAAGDERIAFCGNGALNELNKIVQGDANSEIQFGQVIKLYGMNLREWILPQGRLYLRTHPLMSRNARYTRSMFVLDFSALRWRYMPGRDTHFKDNIQGNDEDTRKGMWLTEGGLEVRYGGLTCAYIGNISAT